jgi:5-methylcytosine-specific restriction endonuclease McrA
MHRERSRQWYVAHPDESNTRSRQWRAAHPDEVRAASREWAEKHPEKSRAIKHKWASTNRDKIRIKDFNWRGANQDKVIIYSHNRRARINGNGGRLPANVEKILFERQGGLCFYCQTELYESRAFYYLGVRIHERTKPHIEHLIPISPPHCGPNTIENVVLACPKCNLKKSAKTAIEFVNDATLDTGAWSGQLWADHHTSRIRLTWADSRKKKG